MPSRFRTHNSFIDKSFAAGNSADYYLCLQTGTHNTGFAVFNPVTKKYIVLEAFITGDTKPGDELHNLKNLLEERTWLRQTFSKVFLIIDNPLSTLVPPPLFNESEAMMYLSYNHPADEHFAAYFNHLKTAGVVTVFGVAKSLTELAEATWKNVNYRHCSSVLIESLLINYKNKTDSNTLFLNVRDGGFDLVYFKNNKLHFHNFFRYNTKEDFIYFLLTAVEELQLNPEQLNLMLSGNIDKSSILYEMIYRYIRSIRFVDRNEVFGYSYVMDELMGHKQYTLFNVLTCE
jgi:hypothetical protein